MLRLFLFCLFVFSAFDTEARVPFSRTIWLNENNSAIRVNTLFQATTEKIYIGTDNGLFSFNGREIRIISDSLNTAVTAIQEFNKTIWVGFDNGMIGFVKNDRIILYPLHGSIPDVAISSISFLGSDRFFLSTKGSGIFLVQHGLSLGFDSESGLSDNYCYQLQETNSGSYLINTDQGINRVTFQDSFLVKKYNTRNGLPDNIVRIARKHPNINYWYLGTQQSGISVFNEEQSTFRSLIPEWRYGQVNDLRFADDQHLIAVTNSGYLLIIDLSKENADVRSFYFQDKKLNTVITDKSGNIWIGTLQGLLQVTELFMSNLPVKHYFDLKKITAMASWRDILYYTQDQEVYRYNPEQETGDFVFRVPTEITSLYIDDEHHFWIGTLGQGLWYSTGKMATPAIGYENKNKAQILNISGFGNHIYVSSLNGADEFIYNKNRLKKIRSFNKSNGLGSDYIYQTLAEKDGSVWFSTDGNGLIKYEQGQFRKIAGKLFRNGVSYSVVTTDEGHVFSGTLEDGLIHRTNDKWERIDREDGLQDETISGLAATADGTIVSVNARGIDILYKPFYRVKHINKRSGLGIEELSPVLNCITKNAKGDVFLPYQNGFVRINTNAPVKDIAPGIKLNSVSLFFNPVADNRNRFNAQENYISFDFEGTNFVNPEQLFYRYKLEGYNDSWVPTSDEQISFPQLNPGKYNLKLQVGLDKNFNLAREEEYAFSIDKPWYKEPWFIIIAIAAFATIVYAFLKWREQGLKRIAHLQKERMTFDYEQLKNQVNPHFLFNSLNTLISLIEEDRDAAVSYTTELSDLYRISLGNKDKDLIYLAEEMDMLRKYWYIQKSRFGTGLEWEIRIDPLILKGKKLIPMALQLLVENAIKHNVVSPTHPLLITITADKDKVIVRNKIKEKRSKEKSTGLGITNIILRYQQLTREPVCIERVGDEFVAQIPLL